jgi:hypothetical protein
MMEWEMNMEQLVEWGLAGETEVLGENLPECHFVYYKFHVTWNTIEPGPSQREAGDYPPDTAFNNLILMQSLKGLQASVLI